ncbi:mucin TcMUC [Trypanosoma cruzi Dm28c]|uniref:Mucin TcMUC n=1 Tax=Trypanosoma cruzi Dm28c TaxID=1416333 RepID=V5D347_TRYCR|nr:mucin TcMUC [Trypanosoma cruzi Dm28c]
MVEVRPIQNCNQVLLPIIYKEKLQMIRKRGKLARVRLQNKEIRVKKIPPRRPLQPPQPLRPPRLLRLRHQVLRLQRRQVRRPPAHRHVFAESTAASAALRGCVPRCCSPHPRWRTPLWAEGVYAGCACQHSTA